MKAAKVYSGGNRISRIYRGSEEIWREDNDLAFIIVRAGGGGSVTGQGIYRKGHDATIEAIPSQGFVFVKWEDGNRQALRIVTARQDTVYSAIFARADFGILNYFENY